MVVTVVVTHTTSREVVYGSKVIVVGVGRVNGGKMKLHGGKQEIVGSDSEYISCPINTLPEPLSEPSGSAPSMPAFGSMLARLDMVPGPPRSTAQAKVPVRHSEFAKSRFWRRVSASSYDTLLAKSPGQFLLMRFGTAQDLPLIVIPGNPFHSGFSIILHIWGVVLQNAGDLII